MQIKYSTEPFGRKEEKTKKPWDFSQGFGFLCLFLQDGENKGEDDKANGGDGGQPLQLGV